MRVPGRSDALVLCYHALSPTWDADLSVTPEAFAEQMDLLDRAGYRGVTFTELLQAPVRGRRVAVTFDDAFASVPALAGPVLDRHGWPGTVFAVSGFASTGRPLEWDGVSHWAQTPHAHELGSLDWAALRELRDRGWEIGSHTVEHPRLTTVDDERLERELSASRVAIEEALGAPCTSVAYPYGDVDRRVTAAAARAGYAAGAALPARWGTEEPLEWPRVGVYHPDTAGRFRLKSARSMRRARTFLRR